MNSDLAIDKIDILLELSKRLVFSTGTIPLSMIVCQRVSIVSWNSS